MEAYKTIKSEKTYEGIIIDVVQDEITLPDGRTAKREVILRSDAAAILPVDAEGNLIFVAISSPRKANGFGDSGRYV